MRRSEGNLSQDDLARFDYQDASTICVMEVISSHVISMDVRQLSNFWYSSDDEEKDSLTQINREMYRLYVA